MKIYYEAVKSGKKDVAGRPQLKVFSARLPRELVRRLKIQAAMQEVSVESIVAVAIERYLKSMSRASPTAAR